MNVNMKFMLLFLVALAVACSSMPISERYIHSGTRAFSIHYGGTQFSEPEPKSGPTYFFTALTTGKLKEESTPAQKAYAYTYLAKIELRKGNVPEALRLLNKAETESNLFPYKDEILGDYYFKNSDFSKSNGYYVSLIQWIDNRIASLSAGSFDVNSLEFMNIRSYVDSKFEDKYMDMFNKKLPKETRENLYTQFLVQKKMLAQQRILQTFTKNKN